MNLFFLTPPNSQLTFQPPSQHGDCDSRFALESRSLLRGLQSTVSPRAWAMFVITLVAVLASLMLASHASAEPGAATTAPVNVASLSEAKAAQASGGGAVVNINTADAATLALKLRGVGQSRAQEIVRHREAFGPFASPDELMEVKGIGQSTLEQNRSRITLE